MGCTLIVESPRARLVISSFMCIFNVGVSFSSYGEHLETEPRVKYSDHRPPVLEALELDLLICCVRQHILEMIVLTSLIV